MLIKYCFTWVNLKGYHFRKMAPSKAQRQKCWSARDAFWECMETNSNDCGKCKAPRTDYENSCSKSWVCMCVDACSNNNRKITFILPGNQAQRHITTKRSVKVSK